MLRDDWIVVAIVLAFLATFAFLIWLWWWIPRWQMRAVTAADPKARADIEDNFRSTVGQGLGSLAVLLGTVFGAGWAYVQLSQQQQAIHDQLYQRPKPMTFYCRSSLRHGRACPGHPSWQSAASDGRDTPGHDGVTVAGESHQKRRLVLQATRDLLVSNQVSKGFEQLGSKEIVVRLGGLYALEGVMKASPEYYLPVLEALCAFVRERTKGEVKDDPATDVQAALGTMQVTVAEVCTVAIQRRCRRA